MGLLFHLAEIAVLLAVAYAVGWGVGYGLHRVMARPQPVAAIPPERLAAATGAVPSVDPVTVAAPDAAPPPPDPAQEILVSPEGLAAVETPAGGVPPVADAAAAPTAAPPKLTSAQPASRPGLAWSGPRRGAEASKFEAPAPAAPAVAAEPAAPVPIEVAVPEPQPAPVETPPAPVEVVPPRIIPDDAEAMRSIEAIGNPGAAAPVAEAKAAVSAAQAAVEQMLARSGINPPRPEGDGHALGKPVGLPRPRDGVRDDLRRIAGIGPLDVNVLNNLGIFHFDQIAALDEREVLWLENHAFQRGRIAREGWQEQASTLADGGKERLQTLH